MAILNMLEYCLFIYLFIDICIMCILECICMAWESVICIIKCFVVEYRVCMYIYFHIRFVLYTLVCLVVMIQLALLIITRLHISRASILVNGTQSILFLIVKRVLTDCMCLNTFLVHLALYFDVLVVLRSDVLFTGIQFMLYCQTSAFWLYFDLLYINVLLNVISVFIAATIAVNFCFIWSSVNSFITC